MWIQISSFDSTDVFDNAYLAFDARTKIKVHDALEKLRGLPVSPELDLRPYGAFSRNIYTIKIDGSLRLMFKNAHGTAELRMLLIDERIDPE